VASWVELEITPKPSVPSVRATAPPHARAAAAELVERRSTRLLETQKWSFGIAGDFLWFSTGLALRGGLADFAYRVHPHVVLSFATSAQYRSDSVDMGKVKILSVTGTPRLSLVTSVEHLELAAGVGARVGFVRVEGNSTEGARTEDEKFFAPWGGGVIQIGV